MGQALSKSSALSKRKTELPANRSTQQTQATAQQTTLPAAIPKEHDSGQSWK